jgi:hypothetical protein
MKSWRPWFERLNWCRRLLSRRLHRPTAWLPDDVDSWQKQHDAVLKIP